MIMNTKESLNSRINRLISTKKALEKACISETTFRKRAKRKGIKGVMIGNNNYYTQEQIDLITSYKIVTTKKEELIAELCLNYPYLSNDELSNMVGIKIIKPKYFIFQSKMNKKL